MNLSKIIGFVIANWKEISLAITAVWTVYQEIRHQLTVAPVVNDTPKQP